MKFIINGATIELRVEPSSLHDLLEHLGYLSTAESRLPANFVVALNQEIVSAKLYPHTLLCAGDQVDVLGVVTGG